MAFQIVTTPIQTDIKIQKLLDERKTARENKDWKKADELRDQITALGFEVKDK